MNDTQYAELESRLWNYSRWLRSDPSKRPGHCYSIEHRYEAPWNAADRYAKSAQQPVDVTDAERIDVAIRSFIGTTVPLVIRAHFVRRVPQHRLCRHLRIDGPLYGEVVRRCAAQLWDKLEAMKGEPYPYLVTGLDIRHKMLERRRHKQWLPAG